MSTNPLRNALLQTSAARLGDVVDWLQRPWAAESNDTLRRLWHEARRDRHTLPVLAFALEQEVQNLGARDVDHVASRLGSAPTSGAVAIAIARRLGAFCPEPAKPPGDAIATAIGAFAELARVVVSVQAPRGRRGRRHGYRRG